MEKNTEKKEKTIATPQECFVLMPISDQEGYEKGQFTKVYEDIFKPACISLGYDPIRADEVKQTNLIHLDILQKLIASPMAICDLSSRNPNVLFELGLRQAFDKPTVLVQEVGTPKIFDIAPLRYTEYRKELRYREVLEDQKSIAQAIKATKEATAKGEGVNSIVSILSLSKPATLKEVTEGDSSGLLQLIRAEMSEMRSDFRKAMFMLENNKAEYYRKIDSPTNPYPWEIDTSTMSYNLDFEQAIDLYTNIEKLFKKGTPKHVILERIHLVKQKLTRLIESDIPDQSRQGVLALYKLCEELELRALDRESKS